MEKGLGMRTQQQLVEGLPIPLLALLSAGAESCSHRSEQCAEVQSEQREEWEGEALVPLYYREDPSDVSMRVDRYYGRFWYLNDKDTTQLLRRLGGGKAKCSMVGVALYSPVASRLRIAVCDPRKSYEIVQVQVDVGPVWSPYLFTIREADASSDDSSRYEMALYSVQGSAIEHLASGLVTQRDGYCGSEPELRAGWLCASYSGWSCARNRAHGVTAWSWNGPRSALYAQVRWEEMMQTGGGYVGPVPVQSELSEMRLDQWPSPVWILATMPERAVPEMNSRDGR